MVGIFGFFWFYKLEGVIALGVCFVCILRRCYIFLLPVCRWRGDDQLMFLFRWNFWHWWECAWFSRCRVCTQFDFTLLLLSSDLWDESFVFPYVYVDSFVLLMKRLLLAHKSTRCCPLLFRTPRAKVPMQLSLAYCLIFLPTLAFQFPVKNKSDLFLSSLRAVLISL